MLSALFRRLNKEISRLLGSCGSHFGAESSLRADRRSQEVNHQAAIAISKKRAGEMLFAPNVLAGCEPREKSTIPCLIPLLPKCFKGICR